MVRIKVRGLLQARAQAAIRAMVPILVRQVAPQHPPDQALAQQVDIIRVHMVYQPAAASEY
jgi:hypothetical protein